MNKNLFIYSFKYLAVLLALVTFSSCERTEFTEEDALTLENARLDAQLARDIEAGKAEDTRIKQMALFRRGIDSLTRINSGGKVMYTVNVVPGGSTAFSSGRFEEIEGLTGAKVTVSQFIAGGSTGSGAAAAGYVQTVTTLSGVASFELYSGEATVTIEPVNHTPVNYVVNLTPDGGVRNGSLVYVSNVIPVFDDVANPETGAEANFATIKGFAFAELDITFGNNEEEAVPPGTKVRAYIDVNPAFMAKYINEANDSGEGTNADGIATKSGHVQRIAYQKAVSTVGTTVDAAVPGVDTGATRGGEYSISMPATASGLPIAMKFDDFAAARKYVFGNVLTNTPGSTPVYDGDFGTGSKRFIYTQNTEVGGNQNPSPFFVGYNDLAKSFSTVKFDFATTEAAATATIKSGDVVSVVSTVGGYYYEAPTVTIAAPTSGTTATATAVLGPIDPASVVPADVAARTRGLRKVVSVTLTSGGSGYTAAPAVTFTRKSFTGVTGTAPNANGTGEVAAPSSTVKYIRIMDAGFGMNGLPAGFVLATSAVTGVGNYTGFAPAVVFNGNISPTGNAADIATANTIVDAVVGTATEIQVTNGGNGYDDANLNITFNYGRDASVNTNGSNVLGGAASALFRVGAAGQLLWNVSAAGDRVLTQLNATAAGEVQFVTGSNYTFVPAVAITGLTAPAGATLPTFVATVTNGKVTSVEIQGATSGWGAVNTEVTGTLAINANPDGVNITAKGFTQGGSIDTYEILNYGSTNDVYKSTVEAASQTFNYLTTNANGNGQILNGTNNVMTPADYALNSDFIVVFDNPTAAAGDNAWGYPIFDNGGNNLVGVLIINQGIGYTNPSPATYNFWLVPADLASTPKAALAAYKAGVAGLAGTSSLVSSSLTFTITGKGSGYAVRPEFVLSGGNKSAEDLATINTAINAWIRPLLKFNTAGEITNTAPLTYPGGIAPFTATEVAATPIVVTVSVSRLERDFTSNANGALAMNTRVEPSASTVAATNNGGTVYNSTYRYLVAGTSVSARDFFTNTVSPATTGMPTTYISAPTFTVDFNGASTTGAGVGVLNPAAELAGLNTTTVGKLPTGTSINGTTITSLFYNGNDPSYNPAGERFKTLGGSSKFEVFTGMVYVRDVNYGTGIELE
jgi:hypothetical protein